jgi:hypothetical protein
VGFCDCDTECPGSAACTCLFIVKEGLCVCVCTMETIQLPVMVAEDDLVNLSVRDADLEEVAGFVQRVTGSEVVAPASNRGGSISASIEEAPFAQALAEVGLGLGSTGTAGPTAPGY